MTLKHVLGTMLASRMAGRGGMRGGLGSAAMLGLLGGRRGGLGGKAGLAGLAFMAYQAYQSQQDRTAGRTGGRMQAAGNGTGAGGTGAGGTGGDTAGGGLAAMLGDLANRFGVSTPGQGDAGPAGDGAAREAQQAAEKVSDAKALLLIRAMIAAANADGKITPVERARIVQHLDAAGADSEDRRLVEREMENPKALDDLLAEVRDKSTAQEFYLASRAAVDGQSEAHRAYLQTLRQRLDLSDAEAAEIEGLTT